MGMSDAFLSVATATLSALLLPGVHICLIRLSKEDGRALRPMGLSFLLYGAGWICLYVVLLSGALSMDLVAGASTVGFFCLGYMEAFSMLCRGFSLRLAMDVEANGGMTFEHIKSGYAEGKGIDWLYEQRLQDIEQMGLVHYDGESVELAGGRGYWIGWIGIYAKRLLKLGPGG